MEEFREKHVDMRGVGIGESPDTKYYGLGLSVAAGAGMGEILRDKLAEILTVADEISVMLPCGNIYAIRNADAIPEVGQDIPCPCGNPNHWLVKWEFAQGGGNDAG